MSYLGAPVIISTDALEETDERLFSESRHRSARIKKKLIKRFGGEFKKIPCIWKTPKGYIMHPTMWAKLQEACRRKEAI